MYVDQPCWLHECHLILSHVTDLTALMGQRVWTWLHGPDAAEGIPKGGVHAY